MQLRKLTAADLNVGEEAPYFSPIRKCKRKSRINVRLIRLNISVAKSSTVSS